MRTTVVRHCPGCRTEREFETPPCAEHGSDCPEQACVICGWALVGPFEVAVATGPDPQPATTPSTTSRRAG
jgi:hypothetical protein